MLLLVMLLQAVFVGAKLWEELGPETVEARWRVRSCGGLPVVTVGRSRTTWGDRVAGAEREVPVEGATAPVVTVCTGRAAAAIAVASFEQSRGEERSYVASRLSAIVSAPVVTIGPAAAAGGAVSRAASAPVVTVALCRRPAPGGFKQRGVMLG
jgi:hypothetical protein